MESTQQQQASQQRGRHTAAAAAAAAAAEAEAPGAGGRGTPSPEFASPGGSGSSPGGGYEDDTPGTSRQHALQGGHGEGAGRHLAHDLQAAGGGAGPWDERQGQQQEPPEQQHYEEQPLGEEDYVEEEYQEQGRHRGRGGPSGQSASLLLSEFNDAGGAPAAAAVHAPWARRARPGAPSAARPGPAAHQGASGAALPMPATRARALPAAGAPRTPASDACLPACLSADAADELNPSQADHASSFTTRTRLVLSQLQQAAGGGSQAAGGGSGKRRKLQQQQQQQQQPGAPVVSADELLQHKSRTDASRWFFELLVLRNKGFVDLRQQQAYGDVAVVVAPSGMLLAS